MECSEHVHQYKEVSRITSFTPLKSMMEVNTLESQMEEIFHTGGNNIGLSFSPCQVHKIELVIAGVAWRFYGKILVWMKFVMKSRHMHCKLIIPIINN